jgi:hypothetical protein
MFMFSSQQLKKDQFITLNTILPRAGPLSRRRIAGFVMGHPDNEP